MKSLGAWTKSQQARDKRGNLADKAAPRSDDTQDGDERARSVFESRYSCVKTMPANLRLMETAALRDLLKLDVPLHLLRGHVDTPDCICRSADAPERTSLPAEPDTPRPAAKFGARGSQQNGFNYGAALKKLSGNRADRFGTTVPKPHSAEERAARKERVAREAAALERLQARRQPQGAQVARPLANCEEVLTVVSP